MYKFPSSQLSQFKISSFIYFPYFYTIIIVLLFSTNIPKCHSQSFNDFKLQMQSIAIEIASKTQQFYQNWCSDGIASCETLSYNACVSIRYQQCLTQFPKPSQCLYPGAYLSTASGINFPPGIDFNALSQQDIHFVCASAKLQPIFQNLSKKRNGRFSQMYFGNNRGIFRQFPGQYLGTNNHCDEYDPRNRPWYTIAASGAKNVMILIDISSSMISKSQDIITTAISVVSSLSISDNVGVIAFQSQANVIGNQKSILIRATNDNKQSLIESISNIQFTYDKQTNLISAFTLGLQLVNNTIAQGYSGCSIASNVFLLITDGNPTIDDKISPNTLIETIDNFTIMKQSSLKRLAIFIYALGKYHILLYYRYHNIYYIIGNTNVQYLRNLTCHFNGIVISPQSSSLQLQSTSQASTQLIQFYKYLSVGVKFTQPIWTQPYLDYYTNIEMVTVSMPAYYTDLRTNLTTMFGVAGLDINMKYFTDFGYTADQITMKLTGESACQKNIVDNCKLEGFRSLQYRCDVPNCTQNILYTNNTKLCNNIPSSSSIFTYSNGTTQKSSCCGIMIRQFIFIICTSFGFAFIIAICIWQRKRIWKRFCDRSYRSIRKYQHNFKYHYTLTKDSKNSRDSKNSKQSIEYRESYDNDSNRQVNKLSHHNRNYSNYSNNTMLPRKSSGIWLEQYQDTNKIFAINQQNQPTI